MPEFGNSFSGLANDRKVTHSELVRAIRYSIAAEYEAIQLYEQLAESTDNKLAKKVLLDIAREEVVHAAPDFVFRDLGVFPLAGKAAPQRIFELIGRAGGVDESRLRFVASFESARRLVELGDLDGAQRALEALAATMPADGPTQYYLDIVAGQIDTPPRARKDVNR